MHQGHDSSRAEDVRPESGNRRSFLVKASAICLGGIAMLPPLGAGVMVVLDPLRRKSGEGTFVRVTSMQSLPEDGLPRKFVVVSSHSDAWNRTAAMPIGAVYLRRAGPNAVQAFNVVCPHLGCFVEFVGAGKGYFCPCHNSAFALDGKISDRKSPSPRGLDQLDVEIRNETEIWVRFQNFLTGRHKKIPIA